MPRSRQAALIDRSLAACLAAVEIYNKPNFQYREEAFSILMLNAWELLLKARIVQKNRGQLKSIEIWERSRKRDGTLGRSRRRKRNRTGNAMTIGLTKALEVVRNYGVDGIDQCCLENIRLLSEIRDNSVHLHNVSAGLGKRIQEVGSATLSNFASAAQNWFNVDLDRYNFYLMPLAFHSPAEVVRSLKSQKHPEPAKRLLALISDAERSYPSVQGAPFNVTLQVQLKFTRTSTSEAFPVRVDQGDPAAIPVAVTDEGALRYYPWDYAELTAQLKRRYSDFVQNNAYHAARKPLEEEARFCRVRYLDPSSGRGLKKRFYSPSILAAFDGIYRRKS